MSKKIDQNENQKIVIDARHIPGKNKKEYFFTTFDQLQDNEEMIILHSHDMQPLHKLFKNERTGLFIWENIERGPDLWKISIKKIQSANLTVSDIIHINPEAIYILSEYGIHFYTNLDTQLKNLALNRRDDYQQIIHKILNYKSGLFKKIRPSGWSISLIISYIIENHHHYLDEKLPELQDLISQLTTHFGTDFPHLQALDSRFNQFMEEIIDHLRDEEDKIFPMVIEFSDKEKITDKDLLEIRDKINWIIEDHYLAGDNLLAIRKICNNYQLDKSAIPGIKLLYQELIELEKDFLLHILFENHFLVQAINRKLPQ
jgi:regulator of cell morphogenesis and NO signaling